MELVEQEPNVENQIVADEEFENHLGVGLPEIDPYSCWPW